MKKLIMTVAWWPLLLWGERFELEKDYCELTGNWNIVIEDNVRHERYFYTVQDDCLWEWDLYDFIIWNVPDASESLDFVYFNEFGDNHD